MVKGVLARVALFYCFFYLYWFRPKVVTKYLLCVRTAFGLFKLTIAHKITNCQNTETQPNLQLCQALYIMCHLSHK